MLSHPGHLIGLCSHPYLECVGQRPHQFGLYHSRRTRCITKLAIRTRPEVADGINMSSISVTLVSSFSQQQNPPLAQDFRRFQGGPIRRKSCATGEP